MPRARTIKPGFFGNDELANLRPMVRLLFAGLWCWADKEGRLLDRPKKIKAEVVPYDTLDVEAALRQLVAAGFIVRYEAEGQKCIQILNWLKHQHPHPREDDSSIPPAPGMHESCMPHTSNGHDGNFEHQAGSRSGLSREKAGSSREKVGTGPSGTPSSIPSFPSGTQNPPTPLERGRVSRRKNGVDPEQRMEFPTGVQL